MAARYAWFVTPSDALTMCEYLVRYTAQAVARSVAFWSTQRGKMTPSATPLSGTTSYVRSAPAWSTMCPLLFALMAMVSKDCPFLPARYTRGNTSVQSNYPVSTSGCRVTVISSPRRLGNCVTSSPRKVNCPSGPSYSTWGPSGGRTGPGTGAWGKYTVRVLPLPSARVKRLACCWSREDVATACCIMGFLLLIMGYAVRVGVQPTLCVPHATRIIEEEC